MSIAGYQASTAAIDDVSASPDPKRRASATNVQMETDASPVVLTHRRSTEPKPDYINEQFAVFLANVAKCADRSAAIERTHQFDELQVMCRTFFKKKKKKKKVVPLIYYCVNKVLFVIL
uniref:Uncharacterized protein n=1 Tax=Panagrolaimus superbus TaxID=310955 RepID=A0A914Y0W8_9BILA